MENEDLTESDTEEDSDDEAAGRGQEAEVEVEDDDIDGEQEADTEANSDAGGHRRGDDDEGDDDEDDDEDYTPEDADEEGEVEAEENGEEPEELEEIDKERSDKLWKVFLDSPDKKEETKAPDIKAVKPGKNKVYEFAGERVNVAPKPSSSSSLSNGDKSWMNKSSTSSSSGGRFGGQREVISDKHYPSPRQEFFMMEGRSTIKRGGVSFLSGDPEQIGLGGPATKGGLSNVLAALQNSKRQKMGTLEKSRLDWEAFKKDAGIEDELQTQIKSKDGYIERQEFLQRSDLRAFEIEKNIRTKTRRQP